MKKTNKQIIIQPKRTIKKKQNQMKQKLFKLFIEQIKTMKL